MVESGAAVMKKATSKTSTTPTASRLCARLLDKLELMKSGAAEQCNEPMRCGFNVPDELYACPLCRTIPRISKSTSKTYFGLGDWAAGAPLRSQSFAVTMIGQGLGTVEVFP